MRVELRSGELCETVVCEDDVFFIACRLTGPNGHPIISVDLKRIFDTAGYHAKELCLANGMRLEMCLFTTDNPFLLSMMKSYVGLKIEEVVHGDTEFTITV